MLGVTFAFVVNVYLSYWRGWPGAGPAIGLSGNGGAPDALLSGIQAAVYMAAVGLGILAVVMRGDVGLRADSKVISDFNAYLIRACFWAVLLVGVVDGVISFLRIEGLLEGVVGKDLAGALGRSNFRGPYVHMPLVGISFVIALFTRTLGFTWLALLVVAAELLIVIARFVFSYEQALMSDLVRFWYAALFLFASAYTLIEEGHVRVDVAYAGLSARMKGWFNATGTLLFGLPFCWTILLLGAGSKQSVIVSPMVTYEVTQAGFGLYIKYFMAGFLGVFAVTMLIQFVSYLFDAVADVREEPGGRNHDSHNVQ
ncbi:MAG: TRAP transporter small permease subunit [Rhizobiales bacterium]|nr:TRAP transporter small permease subunit [Hyphomicrobiales bacterium]